MLELHLSLGPSLENQAGGLPVGSQARDSLQPAKNAASCWTCSALERVER
jgi:hypothetical protein